MNHPININQVSDRIIGHDIKGRVVVMEEMSFDNAPADRRFLALDGFGCNPHSQGKAVFGKLLHNGQEGRVSRLDIEGFAKYDTVNQAGQKGDFQKVESVLEKA